MSLSRRLGLTAAGCLLGAFQSLAQVSNELCDQIGAEPAWYASPEGSCLSEFVMGWGSGFNPRSLLSTEFGELVVLDAGSASILLFSDDNQNLKVDPDESFTLFKMSKGKQAINHGILY